MNTNNKNVSGPRRAHVLRPALRLALRLCFAAGAVCLGQAAVAATATATMSVTATVTSSCTITTTTLAFGSVTSAAIVAGVIEGSGAVNVTCTTGWPYTVAIDKGAGTGGTVAIRKMTLGTNTLNYTIYTAADRVTIWGDVAGATVAGTGNGAIQAIPAYGRIFSPQTVQAGSYSDTVNVTVAY